MYYQKNKFEKHICIKHIICAILTLYLNPSVLLGAPWTSCAVLNRDDVWSICLLNVHLSLSVVPLPTTTPLCSCTLCVAYVAMILHTVLIAKLNNCTVCVSDALALLFVFRIASYWLQCQISLFRLNELCNVLYAVVIGKAVSYEAQLMINKPVNPHTCFLHANTHTHPRLFPHIFHLNDLF